MAAVAEAWYADEHGLGPDRLTGLAVTRTGYAQPTRWLEMVEAGHPVPTQAGIEATRRTLALAQEAGPDDLVLVLLSGGGSANWIAPAGGLDLTGKQAITRALLRSGASIGEINTLRKRLSLIKGGRLARLAAPARLLTLAVSDVPGDDPRPSHRDPPFPIRRPQRRRAPSSRSTASTCRRRRRRCWPTLPTRRPSLGTPLSRGRSSASSRALATALMRLWRWPAARATRWSTSARTSRARRGRWR